jgi:hypothetical protein
MFVLLYTAGAGITLLAGALANERSARPEPGPDPSDVPAKAAVTAQAAATASLIADEPAASAAPARRRGKPDPFAPPSLVRSRTEPIPWGRTLLEFSHPALAIVGIGMWIGFTLIHQKVLGVVAGGVLLVAATAGVSWYLSGRRGSGLPVNRRTLATHAVGAALALALAIFTLARL